MKSKLLLSLLAALFVLGCDTATSSQPVEFIDLRPHAETKTTATSKPVVYFYTQKPCAPCRKHERFWDDCKWETPSFRVEKVDIGEKQAPWWVSSTPCYGWKIGNEEFSIQDGRPADQVEGSWKATNK